MVVGSSGETWSCFAMESFVSLKLIPLDCGSRNGFDGASKLTSRPLRKWSCGNTFVNGLWCSGFGLQMMYLIIRHAGKPFLDLELQAIDSNRIRSKCTNPCVQTIPFFLLVIRLFVLSTFCVSSFCAFDLLS